MGNCSVQIRRAFDQKIRPLLEGKGGRPESKKGKKGDGGGRSAQGKKGDN